MSVAALALVMVGCASSDKSTAQLSSHWSTAKFGAPAEAGLSAEASQAAANARILADVPAKDVDLKAVVVTSRAPLFESPSTSSKLVGTVVQGGEVDVEQALLWFRLPDQWHGGRWGEQDGLLPTWAKVDARGVSGYMPWRCLGESLKDPAKVERGALAIEGDTLESSRKNFSEKKTKDEKRRIARGTKGMAGGEIAQGSPDFESVDGFLALSGTPPLPPSESAVGIEIDLKSPSAAEEFFVGRISAARILGAQPAFDPA
ncbi:MAG: SH3 domain-containing protein, partial [Phycisphaerales bacterium]